MRRQHIEDLTERQLEILRYMAEGLIARTIRDKTGVMESTIRSHQTEIYDRLGAKNSAHAVAIAMRKGLMT